MEQYKINRINELSKLSRERELTKEEQKERASLRQEYVNAFKKSLVSQLENTYIVDEKGNKKKVQKREDKNKS